MRSERARTHTHTQNEQKRTSPHLVESSSSHVNFFPCTLKSRSPVGTLTGEQ